MKYKSEVVKKIHNKRRLRLINNIVYIFTEFLVCASIFVLGYILLIIL